jgi:hypothetical protein
MTVAGPSLECRLLAAYGCAYGIADNGAYTPRQPYCDAAGFGPAPTALVGGLDDINACLVGVNGDGVIVAFRGTLHFDIHDASSLLDWAEDFNAGLISVPGIPGQLHHGFWNALNASNLWDRLLAQVQTLLAGPGNLPLHIAGHSKGGGLAHLAAMRFHAAGLTPQAVYTYAVPRVGDQDFADAYNQAIMAIRYENRNDIVPHLPLRGWLQTALAHLPAMAGRAQLLHLWDYADVGTLHFIRWDGTIVGDSRLLELERVVRLTALLTTLNFGQIVADHTSDCGGGYMTAVCPGVCGGGCRVGRVEKLLLDFPGPAASVAARLARGARNGLHHEQKWQAKGT